VTAGLSASLLLDDQGRAFPPGLSAKRIVSLVPSDTYTLVRLGVGDRLVGRTDYCTEPSTAVANVATIGGTKNPRIADVLDLQPDLVIANQEENGRKDIEALLEKGVKVFVTMPRRFGDGMGLVARLARLLGIHQDEKVKELVRSNYHLVRQAEEARAVLTPLTTFVPIWMDPLMTANSDTFLSDTLDLVGAKNVFAERTRRYPLAADLGVAQPLPEDKLEGKDTRYPRITLDEVIAAQPELVLLPDEPHAFTEQDAEVFRALAIPAAKHDAVERIVGKDIMWPGQQAIDGLARLASTVAAARDKLPARRPS
jgi:ABC-type Fe3+-hydroxamate transport system substrate-binding protein